MITIQGEKYMSDFEAKKAIIDIGKRMYAKGYLVADDGCISIKTGPDALWMTPAGVEKGFLTTDMLVKVNLSGKVLMGMVGKAKELPEEAGMIFQVYKCCEDIRCVIHGYPPLANIFAIKGQAMVQANFSKAIRRLGTVNVLENQSPEGIAGVCREAHGVLLRHNGSMTWAKDWQSCYHYMETMEYYATVSGHMDAPVQVPVMPESIVPERAVSEWVTPEVAAPVNTYRSVGGTSGSPVYKPAAGLKGVTALVRPGDARSVETIRPVRITRPVQTTSPVAESSIDKAAVMAEVVRQVTRALQK